ncbi:hypothetical protein CerSpe_163070 [Prunus speciosa]
MRIFDLNPPTLQALSNIELIIDVQNQDIQSLGNDITATTACVENNVLNYFPDVKFSSYPPSAGSFSKAASSYLNPIITFLASNGSLLLDNVYPYFSYIGDTKDISFGYALFLLVLH